MKTRTLTALFVTVALSLGMISNAAAYCDNKYQPSSYSQSIPKADGSLDIMMSFQDRDYQPGGSLQMYLNGRLMRSATNGYIQYTMPRGAGIVTFHAGNYNTCGQLLQIVPLPGMFQN